MPFSNTSLSIDTLFSTIRYLLFFIIVFVVCLFSTTKSYADNRHLESTDPNLDLPTFLSGVKYAFLVLAPNEQVEIDQNHHSVLLNNFANYLRSIGFSGVGISTAEKLQLLEQSESYCDIAYIKIDMQVSDKFFTRHSIDITTCVGSEFRYSNNDTLYKDAFLIDKLFTVWKKMQRDKVPYFEANRLRLPSYATSWTLESIDNYLRKTVDLLPFEGIYELVADANINKKAKLALMTNATGSYDALYLTGAENFKDWELGEKIGELARTNVPNVFTTKWVLANKTRDVNAIATLTENDLIVKLNNQTVLQYRKMQAVQSISPNMPTTPPMTTGTGVMVASTGYIVTNNHVVEGARQLWVEINNSTTKERFQAVLIKNDTVNDLALLKISDRNTKGSTALPFQFRTNLVDMGEDVFTLGYPLTESMGDNVKLNTGIVSSQTGFKGDANTYQISTPVSPGNSGGPLFDSYGNLIGIIKSRHSKAENVTYSIKSSLIYNFLLRQVPAESLLKTTPKQEEAPQLKELVKRLENYVFLIKGW